MTRIAYVNGRYLPHRDARVHIEDRGYQFADAVYEVVAIADGRLVDGDGHNDRLERSLKELRIAMPMTRRALEMVMAEVIRRNAIRNGSIYLQMSRGVAPRDHPFPAHPKTQVVMTAKHAAPPSRKVAEEGVRVITLEDIRWRRCDIKSLALLPNVLGKQQAVTAGAYEALQVDEEGNITEGTSTNAWIVTAAGKLVTRPLGAEILAGVVRRSLVAILGEMKLEFEQRPFALAELRGAKEAFLTSSSAFLLPVTRLDGAPVGDGSVGPLARELRRRMDAEVARQSAA